ncbi:MAG: GntR family transcriptional regulator [Hyphomicrobiales bacterium]
MYQFEIWIPNLARNTAPGSLPVYLQISEMLIRDIGSGRLRDGERLPPEREMAASLSISVGTLRKSLSELEKQKLLERVHGSGNYVRASGNPSGVYAFFRLELVQGGGLPTAEILEIERLPKPEDLPVFGVSPDGHRIRRLRCLDGIPAAVEEIWLDASYVENLSRDEISESLYLYYRQALNLWITRVEDRVGVGHVPNWAPDGFGQPPGAPTGLVERLSFAKDGRIAEFSRNWFDADMARYITRMK